jgi:trans-resveratrol di-O-methyltransferase
VQVPGNLLGSTSVVLGFNFLVSSFIRPNLSSSNDITTTKLLFDALMMVLLTGKERNKKEWEKLFLEAGFSHYKIVSSLGMKSLIEVYP